MESEDRKFLIWILFSLLTGFPAHIRADCSRLSCRLCAGNRETAGIGLKRLFLLRPRRDVRSLKNRLWTAAVWCHSGTLATINISKGIPLSNQQSLFPSASYLLLFQSLSFHLPSPLTQLHLLSFCPFGHILPAVFSLCCSSSCSAATPPEGQTGRKQQVSSWWGCVFTDTHSETERNKRVTKRLMRN